VKLSLSAISTPNASFAEDVEAYAAAGFDAIGLWEFKLPEDDAANRRLLRRHRLDVANCVPIVPSILQLAIPGMEGPSDPEERIESLCDSVRRLAPYAPESIVCLTGPQGPRSEVEARETVIEGLRRVAAVAAAENVRLGLEPIHPSQRPSTSFVTSIADALALLDEAELPEVGIMADTYNLADEDPADLAKVVDRVTGLHVASWPEDADRTDRELPHLNAERTQQLVDAVRSHPCCWQGSLDVEIFSTPDAFWALPPDEAARQAYASASAL
jgi:sugar phosphate isomerase/epimerase